MCSSHLHKSPSQNFNEKIKGDRKRNNMDKMFLCIQASNRKINSRFDGLESVGQDFPTTCFFIKKRWFSKPKSFWHHICLNKTL